MRETWLFRPLGVTITSIMSDSVFFTGCRPSEAIGLTWDAIASDFSRITFRQAVLQEEGGSHGTGLRPRSIAFFLAIDRSKRSWEIPNNNYQIQTMFSQAAGETLCRKETFWLVNGSLFWKRLTSYIEHLTPWGTHLLRSAWNMAWTRCSKVGWQLGWDYLSALRWEQTDARARALINVISPHLPGVHLIIFKVIIF